MSLFSVCNWWSAQCTDLDENYDVASLLCARFGIEEHEKDYIAVSSHFGHLSIFYPSLEAERLGDNNDKGNGFKATDLLLEMKLHAPILGIYAGRFSANSANENTQQLAVLHPTSVAVYRLQSVSGVAEHGTQLKLHLLAEYKFQRVAYTFCKGHFGQVKGREFFCIAHLDGTLSFYEQDGINYECQFPGQRSLPAPLAYCERTDSFLRFSATWNLECFTYQDLSHSSINKSYYQPVWSVCLGEGILDMSVVQFKEEYASIMILGERCFISLFDNGKVDFILKLDYAPKCFHCFVVGYYWEPTARLITGIISEKGRLFIYDKANIIWAAQYQDATPVAMQRANLNGLPGAIVALGPTGQLRLGYLGSDPYLFKAPPLDMNELSFEQAHKELMQLEQEIKEAVDIRDMESINKRAYEDVDIQFSISSELNTDADVLLLDLPAEVALKELPACSARLKFKCRIDLAELQIIFNLPEGIKCSQEALFFADISAGKTEILDLEFYVAELLHIHTARIDAVVTFITTMGMPRVLERSAYLPLNMFFKLKQPQKAALTKLTYSITAKALVPKLSTFFPEFVDWESEAQALGLILLCPGNEKAEEIITIVAAKNSNRFRLQSDSLETFPMILERLINTAMEKDEAAKNATKNAKGQINRRVENIVCSPVIPIAQILNRIDLHRQSQDSIRSQTLEIDNLWDQFKTLQRKLQEKSDDEPKETLVMQIEENYDQLIAKGDKLLEMRRDERSLRANLSCAIAVAKWIISTLTLEEKLVNIISSVLCTPCHDWTELSWEESMSPGIDMLHHYGPLNRLKQSTTTQDAAKPAQSTSFENFDYTRFRRHFSLLFERVINLANTTEALQRKSDPSKQATSDEVTTAMPNVTPTAGAIRKVHALKQHAFKPTTLEAVVDDDEDEEGEDDADDLSKAGYKKEHGLQADKKTNDNECSDWVNENFELPSSDELFSDLGIWW